MALTHLSLWSLVSNLACLILGGLTAWGYFKKNTIENAERSVSINAELVTGQEKLIASLRRDIESLQQMTRMQEKRLYRVEIESQRKNRLLYISRQEIEFFEDIVRIVLPALAKLSVDEKKRVEALLTQLSQFRLRTYQEQDDWEETQAAMGVYLEKEKES